VYYFQNCYWYPPQLPHRQVGYKEQSTDYIFGTLQIIFHLFCGVSRTFVYSGVDYCMLRGESSKCRGSVTVRYILRHDHTHKWVTGDKHSVTYWWHGSLLSSQFVEIWEYFYILEGIILYSMEDVISVLLSKLLVAVSTITIRTKWLQGTIYRLHIWVIVFYFPLILCSFQNIRVF
jgi:hypothetical protein